MFSDYTGEVIQWLPFLLPFFICTLTFIRLNGTGELFVDNNYVHGGCTPGVMFSGTDFGVPVCI